VVLKELLKKTRHCCIYYDRDWLMELHENDRHASYGGVLRGAHCGPEHLFFRVRADDGKIYILQRDTSALDGEWDLVSFRQK
jgi:hypothetical protein